MSFISELLMGIGSLFSRKPSTKQSRSSEKVVKSARQEDPKAEALDPQTPMVIPEDSKEAAELAKEFFEKKEYEKAARIAETLLKRAGQLVYNGPSQFELRKSLAIAYIEMKEFDKAKAIIEQNIEALAAHGQHVSKPLEWYMAHYKGDTVRALKEKRSRTHG